MSRSWAAGSTRQWRKLREAVLARDGYRCQVPKGADVCGEHATHVDHIVPLADGGQKWDPMNCRASCASCNLSRGTQATKAGPTVPVTVLIGPPGGGKTTHALERAQRGDVVVDLDRLAAALAPVSMAHAVGHDYPQHVRNVAIGARSAALRRAVSLPASSGARVFVIHATPTVAQLRQYVADGWVVEVVDPGPVVVRARVADSTRGARHQRAADEWYLRREHLLAVLNPEREWDW
ncbi:HNH endonuclease [Cellulosimicrobium cellulans]|uniref:HNH endonuclease n=1 Tax=Cellulosimicrobium cellulans TaxID=1710 RepID=UPI003654B1E7